MLKPFAELTGLWDVSVKGEVSDEYAADLRLSMMGSKTRFTTRSRGKSDVQVCFREGLVLQLLVLSVVDFSRLCRLPGLFSGYMYLPYAVYASRNLLLHRLETMVSGS